MGERPTHTPLHLWLHDGCVIHIRYHPVSGEREYLQAPKGGGPDGPFRILKEVPEGASRLWVLNAVQLES
jgi:hypothetical protein